MRSAVIMCLFYLYSSVAQAAPILFHSVAEKSTLAFEATQNQAAVTGAFPQFDATIAFHPEFLSDSHVEVVIGMQHLEMAYADAAQTLHTKDWFDSQTFPKAVLKTQRFTRINETQFTADSELTIKDYTLPVTLHFTLEQFSSEAAKVTGTATLQRLDYHIGWPETDSVANEVTVSFTLEAEATR